MPSFPNLDVRVCRDVLESGDRTRPHGPRQLIKVNCSETKMAKIIIVDFNNSSWKQSHISPEAFSRLPGVLEQVQTQLDLCRSLGETICQTTGPDTLEVLRKTTTYKSPLCVVF